MENSNMKIFKIKLTKKKKSFTGEYIGTMFRVSTPNHDGIAFEFYEQDGETGKYSIRGYMNHSDYARYCWKEEDIRENIGSGMWEVVT